MAGGGGGGGHKVIPSETPVTMAAAPAPTPHRQEQANEVVLPSSFGDRTCGNIDVISGRGGGTNLHSGNRYYRELILSHSAAYDEVSKAKKPHIAKEIVQMIRRQGGRFLRKDNKDGLFYEIGDEAAREKTSQALRHRTLEMRRAERKRKAEQGIPSVTKIPARLDATSRNIKEKHRRRGDELKLAEDVHYDDSTSMALAGGRGESMAAFDRPRLTTTEWHKSMRNKGQKVGYSHAFSGYQQQTARLCPEGGSRGISNAPETQGYSTSAAMADGGGGRSIVPGDVERTKDPFSSSFSLPSFSTTSGVTHDGSASTFVGAINTVNEGIRRVMASKRTGVGTLPPLPSETTTNASSPRSSNFILPPHRHLLLSAATAGTNTTRYYPTSSIGGVDHYFLRQQRRLLHEHYEESNTVLRGSAAGELRTAHQERVQQEPAYIDSSANTLLRGYDRNPAIFFEENAPRHFVDSNAFFNPTSANSSRPNPMSMARNHQEDLRRHSMPPGAAIIREGSAGIQNNTSRVMQSAPPTSGTSRTTASPPYSKLLLRPPRRHGEQDTALHSASPLLSAQILQEEAGSLGFSAPLPYFFAPGAVRASGRTLLQPTQPTVWDEQRRRTATMIRTSGYFGQSAADWRRRQQLQLLEQQYYAAAMTTVGVAPVPPTSWYPRVFFNGNTSTTNTTLGAASNRSIPSAAADAAHISFSSMRQVIAAAEERVAMLTGESRTRRSQREDDDERR